MPGRMSKAGKSLLPPLLLCPSVFFVPLQPEGKATPQVTDGVDGSLDFLMLGTAVLCLRLYLELFVFHALGKNQILPNRVFW